MLATPVRAFVHDVSPGLANPPRRVVNNIFFPAHPYFDTTAPMLTRRPLAPAAPRRLPRHRSPRLDIDHGILRTTTSTTAPPPTLSATSTNGTKGYRLLEQPRWFPLQPRLPRCVDCYDCGGCPSACLRILLQSHRLCYYHCDCGGMLSNMIVLGNIA